MLRFALFAAGGLRAVKLMTQVALIGTIKLFAAKARALGGTLHWAHSKNYDIPNGKFSSMLIVFCLTVVGTCIDLLYRMNRDPDFDPLWLRLISPVNGGQLMFVPVWLIGPIALVWGLFAQS